MQKLQCRSFFIFALIPLKCMRFYMSKLAAFRQLKKLAEQIHAIEALKGDADLRKEIEFKTELCTLPAEYDYRLPLVTHRLLLAESRQS